MQSSIHAKSDQAWPPSRMGTPSTMAGSARFSAVFPPHHTGTLICGQPVPIDPTTPWHLCESCKGVLVATILRHLLYPRNERGSLMWPGFPLEEGLGSRPVQHPTNTPLSQSVLFLPSPVDNTGSFISLKHFNILWASVGIGNKPACRSLLKRHGSTHLNAIFGAAGERLVGVLRTTTGIEDPTIDDMQAVVEGCLDAGGRCGEWLQDPSSAWEWFNGVEVAAEAMVIAPVSHPYAVHGTLHVGRHAGSVPLEAAGYHRHLDPPPQHITRGVSVPPEPLRPPFPALDRAATVYGGMPSPRLPPRQMNVVAPSPLTSVAARAPQTRHDEVPQPPARQPWEAAAPVPFEADPTLVRRTTAASASPLAESRRILEVLRDELLDASEAEVPERYGKQNLERMVQKLEHMWRE
ncbi:hypothetical protein NLU13_2400 [Sarocladium strictum]|uniref:Uncharacterized protein n=1 Tax=Sarocladium strictum TaxID=5046 RepID=A0AA39GTL4_SARSR|nr:hypothetical protein NLU13_2400 [Sarocladium strictum]